MFHFDDKLKEECGVFGIYDAGDGLDCARLAYFGLYALQHRGQESCGIAVNDQGTIFHHKNMGLVHEVFNDVIINHLKGTSAIGHVRYSTAGESRVENAQPLVLKYSKGSMALAHNGNLVNADEIRAKLEEEGAIFQTTIDSEVIAYLIARARLKSHSIEEAILDVMDVIKGGYSLVILNQRKLIGARDPLGLRPLCIGKIGNSYVFSSESCGLDSVGAEFIRDVEPGEVVIIDENGLSTVKKDIVGKKVCSFEYIYFARQDSIIDGVSVYQSRINMGRKLAQLYPVEADIVIGVPDSGLTSALGYSMESGIQYGEGFVKNRYVGRTFIQPDQAKRETGVKIKLNALSESVKGKRVVMVDDSIVRGTTSRRIVQQLKEAGAKEVHMRITAPPIKFSCFYGIDTPSRQNLVASTHTVDQIRELVSADSLGFITIDGMLEAVSYNKKCSGFCSACFDGDYPAGRPACDKNIKKC